MTAVAASAVVYEGTQLGEDVTVEDHAVVGKQPTLGRRSTAKREPLPPLVVGETRKGFQGADWHEGLLADWDGLRREVARIAAVPAAARLLDLPRMTALAQAPALDDWDSDEAHAHYRLAMLRGVSAGHFLRRAEGSERVVGLGEEQA